MPSDATDRELDAVVIGAGVAGLYQLHQLRELGLRVRAYDAAGDVGGTWWWHYYPGARLDTEGHVYQYLFSPALYEQWGWSERYPAGYEVQRWLRFVADRLDLRRDIELGTRVTGAHWDDARSRWTVRTDRGETLGARFVVSCAGLLPAPRTEIPGRDDFAGLVMDTAHWPERGPELAGRRVGVVGVGTVGVQLVEKIADVVGHLTVFVDRPLHVVPRTNPMYGWREREAYRSRFVELAATAPTTANGTDRDPVHVWADRTPAERRAVLDDAHRAGHLLTAFRDLRRDRDVGDGVTAYVRDAMRARLTDERLIDALVPTDHPVGERPVPLETGYLDAVGREHVEVVDTRATPIARLRRDGVELADGTCRELDVLALTDEFDAGPPALHRVEVRGRGPVDERTSVLGLARPGHPNLLTTGTPFPPGTATSTVLQIQTEWITEAIRALTADGLSRLEATVDGAGTWSTCEVGEYRQRCADEAAAGYPSFVRS